MHATIEMEKEVPRQLTIDFINRLKFLNSNFIEFRDYFEKNMIDLQEKANKLLKFMDNNNATCITTPQKCADVEKTNQNEDILTTLVNEIQEPVDDDDDDDDEKAKYKLNELIMVTNTDNYEEEDGENTSTSKEKNCNYNEKYNLKECKIILNRINSLVNNKKNDIKQINNDEEDSNRDIDNLCNIDNYLEKISKKNTNQKKTSLPKSKSKNQKAKEEEETMDTDENDTEQFGIVKETEDEDDNIKMNGN